jgi:hypothetical protein
MGDWPVTSCCLLRIFVAGMLLLAQDTQLFTSARYSNAPRLSAGIARNQFDLGFATAEDTRAFAEWQLCRVHNTKERAAGDMLGGTTQAGFFAPTVGAAKGYGRRSVGVMRRLRRQLCPPSRADDPLFVLA